MHNNKNTYKIIKNVTKIIWKNVINEKAIKQQTSYDLYIQLVCVVRLSRLPAGLDGRELQFHSSQTRWQSTKTNNTYQLPPIYTVYWYLLMMGH
jgi:hypothetical protein